MTGTGQPGAWRAFAGSLALHGVIVALIAGSYLVFPRPDPPEQRLAIEASVVTMRGARPTPVRPPPEPEPVVAPVPEPEPQPESEPPVPEIDEAKLNAEQEAQRRREAEARVAEERRLAAEREAAQRREAEARQKAEREKAEREKAEREKAAREKAEREKLAAERARAQREAELNAQIQAEERLAAARASGLMAQYIAQITARIERAWIRPPSARAGLDCEVRVTQVPGGAVTAVQITRCNGDDAVKQSIEAAVYRASPLPQPQDLALFERNLVVTFRPED